MPYCEAGLGLVFQTFLQHVLHVGDWSALAALCELQRDEGVEAHAAGAEEGQVVDDAVVEGLDVAGVDDVERPLQVHRDAKMPRQSVARSAGHDAEGGLGVCQRPRHFVHRAVAADSHHDVHLPLHAAPGYLRGVTGIARQLDFVVVQFMIQPLLDEVGNFVLRVGARNRIDDENDLLLIHNHVQNYEKRLIKQLNMQEK